MEKSLPVEFSLELIPLVKCNLLKYTKQNIKRKAQIADAMIELKSVAVPDNRYHIKHFKNT